MQRQTRGKLYLLIDSTDCGKKYVINPVDQSIMLWYNYDTHMNTF